jgi:hypothetical protein
MVVRSHAPIALCGLISIDQTAFPAGTVAILAASRSNARLRCSLPGFPIAVSHPEQFPGASATSALQSNCPEIRRLPDMPARLHDHRGRRTGRQHASTRERCEAGLDLPKCVCSLGKSECTRHSWNRGIKSPVHELANRINVARSRKVSISRYRVLEITLDTCAGSSNEK